MMIIMIIVMKMMVMVVVADRVSTYFPLIVLDTIW